MIAWFATKGVGTNEARRMQELLSALPDTVEWRFDKQAKRASFWRLLHLLKSNPPELLVMEGTGISGGLICLLGRLVWSVPYVFSSGDAVGPFVRAHHPIFGFIFEVYERLLCRYCAGFIGWTPYLCGRALTFGAPRAMTAAGWSMGQNREARTSRAIWRQRWGIPENHIVVGIIGALDWNEHRQFCYGWDLVQAAHGICRDDVSFLIVGAGTGLERLRIVAADKLNHNVFIPGPVSLDDIPSVLSALDVASLPQSMDGVGMFRYTTKISEYVAARCPVITNQIPMAYDLNDGWMWRVPGNPWSETHILALTEILEGLTSNEIAQRQQAISHIADFNRASQINRVRDFINDILQDIESKAKKDPLKC